MKLLELVKRVARPEPKNRWEFAPPAEAIAQSLTINNIYYFNEAVEAKLRAYPIFNWQCTDESVGLDALYLGDEPVASIYRPARKSDYEIEWVSVEAANRVRQFILDNTPECVEQVVLMDPDQEIGDDYFVHYVGQQHVTEGMYEGRPVTIVGGYRVGRADIPYKDERFNKFIVLDNGEERLVDPKKLRFPFNLAD